MSFEVFDRVKHSGRGAKPDPDPYVTITSRGALALNQAAKEAIGSPQYVTLLFDKERRVAAIRPDFERPLVTSYRLTPLRPVERPGEDWNEGRRR